MAKKPTPRAPKKKAAGRKAAGSPTAPLLRSHTGEALKGFV